MEWEGWDTGRDSQWNGQGTGRDMGRLMWEVRENGEGNIRTVGRRSLCRLIVDNGT
jgi:hypothetical protein